MSRIMVFWSDSKIKIPHNVVFRLNREIKMPRNSKIVQKNHEIKMPRKFLALKYKLCDRNYDKIRTSVSMDTEPLSFERPRLSFSFERTGQVGRMFFLSYAFLGDANCTVLNDVWLSLQ